MSYPRGDWKYEAGVFQLVLDAFAPRPKMPFTYVVNVVVRRSSWVWGEASKNKPKDTSFSVPLTNGTILGVFRTHAQKEYGKVWEMKSTPIITILAILSFKTSNAFN